MIKAQSVEMEYIHPHLGHNLKSLLEKMMSQRELAARKAGSSAYISSVIKGNVALIEPHLFNMVQKENTDISFFSNLTVTIIDGTELVMLDSLTGFCCRIPV